LPLIPPTAPHSPSSSSSGAGAIDQTVADVPSGLRLTLPQKLQKKSKVSGNILKFKIGENAYQPLEVLGRLNQMTVSSQFLQMQFRAVSEQRHKIA
jgi:hypothetical protein